MSLSEISWMIRTATATKNHSKSLSTIQSTLYHEYIVTEALLRSNAGTTIGGFIFAVLPSILLPVLPMTSAFQLILKTLVLSICFQYSLDIVNQTTGVTEDEVNKPYRPIPSGLITLEGAKQRWFLAWIIFPSMACLVSGNRAGIWAFIWQLEVAFCYVWPRPNNPVARNLFTGVATFIIVSLVNAIVVEQHPDRDLHVFLRVSLAMWAGIVIQIQEFHDMNGDKAAGKRTLPLVLGEKRIWLMRYGTCLIFFASHSVFLYWGFHLARFSFRPVLLQVTGILQFWLGGVVGLRVVLSNSRAADKSTYYYWLTTLFWIMLIYINLLGTVKGV